MKREVIDMQLTAAERSLPLRYGYPFERIERALKACGASKAIEIVPLDHLELERLIGDVCKSINDMKPGRTRNQLLDLCERLEAAERYGEEMLDEF